MIDNGDPKIIRIPGISPGESISQGEASQAIDQIREFLKRSLADEFEVDAVIDHMNDLLEMQDSPTIRVLYAIDAAVQALQTVGSDDESDISVDVEMTLEGLRGELVQGSTKERLLNLGRELDQRLVDLRKKS